jgi:alanyl-tRNA synthetase
MIPEIVLFNEILMFYENEIVSVYKIGDVDFQICGGPHATNTSELKNFKIAKQEAVSAGVRRIKAVINF